jgi:hypothetical protein
MSPAHCPACEKVVHPLWDSRLWPYCSIVCRQLGRAGLAWRLNPCRIIDPVSGAVLSAGHRFDLSAKAIASLQRQAERLRPPLPEATAQDLPRSFDQSILPSSAPSPEPLPL